MSIRLFKAYDGVEPCPCCGTPGNVKRRARKNGLCDDCLHLVKIGKEMKGYYEDLIDMNMEVGYSRLTTFHLGFEVKARTDLNTLLLNFLKSIPMPQKTNDKCEGYWYEHKDRILNKANLNCLTHEHLLIPKACFEAANELVDKIEEIAQYFRSKEEILFDDYKRKLERMIQEEVYAKKQELIEQGRKDGKNLLMMLNKGEITANEMI